MAEDPSLTPAQHGDPMADPETGIDEGGDVRESFVHDEPSHD
jgi:hypothetical protein